MGTQLCPKAFRRGGEEAIGTGIPAKHKASTLEMPPKAEEAEPAEAQDKGVGGAQQVRGGRHQEPALAKEVSGGSPGKMP